MRRIVLCFAAFLSVGTAVVASAEVAHYSCQDVPKQDGEVVSDDRMMVSVPMLKTSEAQTVVYADFRFEQELAIGTEIEVWPILAGEKQAWELNPLPFARNIWIVDNRTNPLVRFDVTHFVKLWESGALPNLGLVVRLSDNNTSTVQVAQLSAAKSARLDVYTVARSGDNLTRERVTGKPRRNADIPIDGSSIGN